MDANDLNLRWFFDELLAIGKPVDFLTIQKRVKRQSILPAPFTPAVYTREIETPLLNLGWRQDGIKLLPPKPITSLQPVGKLKKVSPQRLRMLRDLAIEKALNDYVNGDGAASELTAALRGLPVDPPSVDKPALPIRDYTQEEAVLTCRALLNSFGLDITITERG